MPVERQVINPKVKNGLLTLGINYEGVEVGDWFIVRSRAFRAVILRSKSRGAAWHMDFDWTEISHHEWRVERVR